MNRWLFVIILGLISASGCAEENCVERISHGPWEAIGQQPPTKTLIDQKFEEGGAHALLSEFGEPMQNSGDEIVWVFEARSTSKRQRCSPSTGDHVYDQSFTIVSVRLDSGAERCFYEIREILSEDIFEVKDVALIPKTSLGMKEASCGVMER